MYRTLKRIHTIINQHVALMDLLNTDLMMETSIDHSHGNGIICVHTWWKWHQLPTYLMDDITWLPTWLEWNHLLADLMEIASPACRPNGNGLNYLRFWWKYHQMPANLMEMASPACRPDGNGLCLSRQLALIARPPPCLSPPLERIRLHSLLQVHQLAELECSKF